VQSKRAVLIATIAVILALAGLGGSFVLFPHHANSDPACSAGPTTHSYVIYESDNPPYKGMNGSYYHFGHDSWPVITVCEGDTVKIHVENVYSSEPHGFQIDNYFPGVTLAPGQSYNVSFVANKAGTFRVFCNIFCLIHPYMINGTLVVLG
jgi:FtsP/CotA-like multicopper oxidase with cupredoxin domain